MPWCLPCAAFQLSATHLFASAIGLSAQRDASLQSGGVAELTGVAELVEVEARGAHDLVASGRGQADRRAVVLRPRHLRRRAVDVEDSACQQQRYCGTGGEECNPDASSDRGGGSPAGTSVCGSESAAPGRQNIAVLFIVPLMILSRLDM